MYFIRIVLSAGLVRRFQCSSRMASYLQSRTCGTALASLKKFPCLPDRQASDFFNHACGMTEPKEASYAGTGVTVQREAKNNNSKPMRINYMIL